MLFWRLIGFCSWLLMTFCFFMINFTINYLLVACLCFFASLCVSACGSPLLVCLRLGAVPLKGLARICSFGGSYRWHWSWQCAFGKNHRPLAEFFQFGWLGLEQTQRNAFMTFVASYCPLKLCDSVAGHPPPLAGRSMFGYCEEWPSGRFQHFTW